MAALVKPEVGQPRLVLGRWCPSLGGRLVTRSRHQRRTLLCVRSDKRSCVAANARIREGQGCSAIAPR